MPVNLQADTVQGTMSRRAHSARTGYTHLVQVLVGNQRKAELGATTNDAGRTAFEKRLESFLAV